MSEKKNRNIIVGWKFNTVNFEVYMGIRLVKSGWEIIGDLRFENDREWIWQLYRRVDWNKNEERWQRESVNRRGLTGLFNNTRLNTGIFKYTTSTLRIMECYVDINLYVDNLSVIQVYSEIILGSMLYQRQEYSSLLNLRLYTTHLSPFCCTSVSLFPW